MAKNAHIHAKLNQLHSEGRLQKTYYALVVGGPAEDRGVIDAPIDRKPLPSLMRYVNQTGKPSVTEYSVLRREKDTSLLALRPITGRTHQLRVHCSYMGFPIVGDPQYGTPHPDWTGQALCAKILEFTHPITGEIVNVQSRFQI